MTRTSKELLALTLALGFAACNKAKPPGTPSVSFVSPVRLAVLTADAGTVSDGLLTFQVTAQVSDAPAGSTVDLTANTEMVNGSTVAAPASGSGEVTLSATLSGGDPGTIYALELELDSAAGTTLATATINITVLLMTSTGPCTVAISPADGSLFNESGTAVPGHNTVQDEDLTTAGMQATLVVTVGSPCPDGPVTLVFGDGTGTQPAPVTSQNRVATFTGITLPETTAAALFDATKLLPVTANAGTGTEASSDLIHYVVDSVIPACTIASPLDGAILTTKDDVDANTPGIQIDVSGTCQGFVGGELISIIDPTTNSSYGTGTIMSGDTFSVEVTVAVGTNALTLSGSSLTGNPATSNTVIATVTTGNCVDAGAPVVTFLAPTIDAGFNLSKDTDTLTAGFQTTLTINTSSMAGSAEFCSSVAPKPGVVQPCPFDANLFEIGTTVSVLGGDATLTDATLGDDGAFPNQTLTAGVTDTCGVLGKGSVIIEVHAIPPVIDSAVVQNTSGPPDGGCFWLNASNLQNGTAQTTVAVTSTIDVADMFDGGPTLTITGTTKQTDSASLTGSGTQSAQVPISLPDGTYQVSATITDVWGNLSAADQFNICVKTSLPTCTIGDNYSNSCFNILDDGDAGATSGAVPVGITVTAANASATDINGNPIDGTVSVSNGGAPISDPIDGGLTVMVSSAQGANAYSATVTDPAGNLAACTPSSLDLTVSTVAPTLTVTPVSSGNGLDKGGCEIYLSRDGISVGIATTEIADGTSLTVQATGPNGGSSANTPATVNSSAASATLNSLPNGIDTVTASGTDSCGNPVTGSSCIDVQATGCDLSLVAPVPTANDAGQLVVFNASQVSDGGTAGIEFHTSCGAGTQVDFSSTASGGSAQAQSSGVDANGDVTFDLTGLVDGSSGTFTADISGGESLPIIAYDAKFTLPAFTGETPAAGNLEVVASQDNLILNDAGVTTLVNAGGTIVANEAQCANNACADFTLSGISGLGPVDGNGNVGTATLTLNFPGFTTSNPNPISIASGSTTVTFSAVSMPQVATGTVTLTLTDNVGNTTTETWSLDTDSLEPPAPTLSAAMSDKRAASVQLSWTVPASNGDSATQAYELAYVVNLLNATPPNIPSEATYASWTLDPGIAGVNGAVGAMLTHVVSPPFATLNQYAFELRAVDAVGNRSALAASATAVSVSSTDSNAWQTLTITENDGNEANSDFGYVVRTGDFNGDGKQDLVITAPYQFASNPTPGIVYIMNGDTAANLAQVTFAGLSSITLGGADFDYFGQDAHVADFNDDTVDDLVVGAPYYNAGQGRIDIFFGHNPKGLSTTPDVTIFGDPTQTGYFGYSVSSADVDGDGIQDLLVGAPGMGTGSGSVYVFLSPKKGTSWPTSAASPDGGPTSPSPTSIISGNPGDGLGAHSGTVPIGDINGDGDGDFAVGAPGGGGTDGLDAGSGTEYGISGASVLANASISVSSGALFTLIGRNPGYCAWGYNSVTPDVAGEPLWECYGVGAIGDVSFTGGQLPDLVVSSGYYSNVYLYTMAKAGPTTPAAFSDDEGFGLGWTLAASDVNGDGHPDLLAGPNDTTTGVYLYLNTGTGLTTQPQPGGVPGEPFSGEIPSPGDGSYFGYGVTAGDYEGIGKQDFAVSDDYPAPYVNVYY